MSTADLLIIHNSQKLETTQMSINNRMDKQRVVYPYNEMIYKL